MIKETGRVVAIETDCLWVETIRQSTCNSCSAQKGCGHGILNKATAGRLNHMRVLLRDQPASDFAVDDEVDISIPEQVLVTGALLVYLLPLISLLAGTLLVSAFWQGDLAAFLGAVLGFIAGLAGVKYHASINRNNMDLQPIVLPKKPNPAIAPVNFVEPA
ncbi:SoxR reducing system RseC family protein [Oceanicoccus sagamiensis]|uniref:Uncharacterized protein n=1 Tax=Oceanicoccus sagamiensis TaxID=716816 RepID=A0A1X9NE73_9GAMM|nr:SoxR reducing system RseC family protein [Oceanicoccus sagamiensis]ARN75354.1 hypothetical protein BST96_15275 [Oceanicoccus sagamiensis]